MSDERSVSLVLPDAVVEAIAARAAAIVLERMGERTERRSSPYATVAEAAEFLRAKPQRIHDLTSAGRLRRFKEGGRTLVLWSELEALVTPTSTRHVASALPMDVRTLAGSRGAR